MYIRSYVEAATTAAVTWSQFFFGGGGSHPQIDYYARNLKTVSTIYNLTVYPNNLPIIVNGTAAVPPNLFSANATGRVTPLGNFTSFKDSIEYFFALALVPAPPAYSVFSKAEVVEFSSGCPEVAASVAYLTTSVYSGNTSNPGPYLSTLKQLLKIAFWRFDKNGAVQDYDAWIPNLSDWNYLAEGKLDISNPLVQAGSIQNLCGNIEKFCVGNNTQYNEFVTLPFSFPQPPFPPPIYLKPSPPYPKTPKARKQNKETDKENNSTTSCISTLTSKPFGTFDEVWGDNIVCRSVHSILASVNPVTHCPHVGPTGGGKCVNESYNEGYFDDEALFGRPRGKVFVCDERGGMGHGGKGCYTGHC